VHGPQQPTASFVFDLVCFESLYSLTTMLAACWYSMRQCLSFVVVCDRSEVDVI